MNREAADWFVFFLLQEADMTIEEQKYIEECRKKLESIARASAAMIMTGT